MRLQRWLIAISLTFGSTLLVATIAQDPPKANPPVDTKPDKLPDGVQIENRGPVHEAFANPGAQTRGGLESSAAPKAPPPPVPEIPPDEKPTGANVTWIPGYWQFDTEKKDFIWVSGFYRNAPPGRTWSAGEWKVENGQHRYIPGYWKLSNESSWRIDLPEPPQSVEAGPNVPAPHNDAQWIPGHWVYRNDNYVWQPGYWGEVEDNMVWTPGQYNYTGSGYRYVTGYWDYCLEDRGLLFAPVFFTRPLWLTPGWAYQPCFGINIGFGGGWGWGWGGFYDNLFIGPGCGSFWFGNCGGWRGWGAGFRPWCWNGGRGFANPVFNHYCWLNRQNPGWRNNLQQGYALRRMGVVPGANRQFNGMNAGGRGRQFNVNQNALNNATNLVSKVGGERAGQQFADRVNKGATIQQVNTALKQTNSPNLVQPAKDVLRNQRLAQSLPSKSTVATDKPALSGNTRSTDIGNSIRNAALNSNTTVASRGAIGTGKVVSNRPSLAPTSESQLRSQIGSAVRSSPSGTIGRSDIARSTRGATEGSSNSVRSGTGSVDSGLRLSSGNNMSSRVTGGSSVGSSSARSLSPSIGSGNSSSSFRSAPSFGGLSDSGSRGSFSGSSNPGSSSRGSLGSGSSNFSGSRGSTMGGSSFSGSRGSAGGSFGGGGSRGGSMGGGGGGSRGGGGGKR
jgi:hypothetical protein